ncbi:unnamed protein product [Amoebophrya sp. A25]|nr:unnamed protein product [Amoebophrya sp. A25]|eukprot:GSA25T00018037001.1
MGRVFEIPPADREREPRRTENRIDIIDACTTTMGKSTTAATTAGTKSSSTTSLSTTSLSTTVLEVEIPPSADPRMNPRLRRNKSSPYLTKYEKCRVLAQRTLQIQSNAPILLDLTKKYDGEVIMLNPSRSEGTDATRIAELELREGLIPYVIRRYLPGRSQGGAEEYEDWRLCDLLDAEDW